MIDSMPFSHLSDTACTANQNGEPAAACPAAQDRAWLDAFRQRTDRSALEQLFRRHAEAMWRVAARQIGAGSADDAVQEAFLAAMRHAHTYRGGSATVKSWLLAITANAARMHARSATRRAQREQVGLPPAIPPEPDAEAEDEMVSELVQAGLAALPDRERQAVLLHYADGLAHAEVAAILACSTVAARKRVQRGLERLRAFLAQRGVGRPLTAVAVAVSDIALLHVPAQAGELAVTCAASGPAAQAPAWMATAAHQITSQWTTLGLSAQLALASGMIAALLTTAAVATSGWNPQWLATAVEAEPQPHAVAPPVDATLMAALTTPVRLRLRRASLDEAITAWQMQIRVRVTKPDGLGEPVDGRIAFISLTGIAARRRLRPSGGTAGSGPPRGRRRRPRRPRCHALARGRSHTGAWS